AEKEGFTATDDAAVAENAGAAVKIVEGTYDNIKVTTKEDVPMEMRVGTGFDVHEFTEGRPLVLGGVEIPYDKGLAGHSDADVLIHAVMDALLGAAAAGDIGKHFPDTDDSWKDVSSVLLLEKTNEIIGAEGYKPSNIDVTLIAERPKISEYTGQMEENIAKALGTDPAAVSVKATTTEGLGFTGRGEGIAAQAICAISK
ncbi:MAG: 2-C-methyl-D-erythritol 2,4-cyclodiphosphate synthase, partial [Firmicutes bacterium]|nr:2-C-methyl-D-erythritol 2,4-cyclodiphosphate synthase [Bacillota bacterium]